jgi:Mg-chelatase subunit ChlI
MRTGFGADPNAAMDQAAREFASKAGCILEVYGEEVANSASRFAASCGRSTVTPQDMAIAAKHEAHEFLDREDLEERVAAIARRNMEEEEEDGEEGEEDDDSEEGEEDEEDEEVVGTPFHTEFRSGGDETRRFHGLALERARQWETWSPQDPVRCLLKVCQPLLLSAGGLPACLGSGPHLP